VYFKGNILLVHKRDACCYFSSQTRVATYHITVGTSFATYANLSCVAVYLRIENSLQ